MGFGVMYMSSRFANHENADSSDFWQVTVASDQSKIKQNQFTELSGYPIIKI